jgi:hypothetical protein
MIPYLQCKRLRLSTGFLFHCREDDGPYCVGLQCDSMTVIHEFTNQATSHDQGYFFSVLCFDDTIIRLFSSLLLLP